MKQINKPLPLQVKLDARHQHMLDALCISLDLDKSKVMRLALRELARRHKI